VKYRAVTDTAPRFSGDANDDFVVELAHKTLSKKYDRAARHRLRTLRSEFRLRHVLSGCYLFSHKVKLPEWGFEQQEVSGAFAFALRRYIEMSPRRDVSSVSCIAVIMNETPNRAEPSRVESDPAHGPGHL
jgi:hypothetical protein